MKKLIGCLILVVLVKTTACSYPPDDPEGYYAALKLPTNASQNDIKKSYRALARDLHPDKLTRKYQKLYAPKNDTDPKIQEKRKKLEAPFKRINTAHEFLKDPEKRSNYGSPTKKRNVFSDATSSSETRDTRSADVLSFILGVASKLRNAQRKDIIVGGIVFTVSSIYILAKLGKNQAKKGQDTCISLGLCKLKVTYTGEATLYREGFFHFSYDFTV